jgi:hypothetical protein
MGKDDLTRKFQGKKLEKEIKSKEPSDKEMMNVLRGGKLPKKMRI